MPLVHSCRCCLARVRRMSSPLGFVDIIRVFARFTQAHHGAPHNNSQHRIHYQTHTIHTARHTHKRRRAENCSRIMKNHNSWLLSRHNIESFYRFVNRKLSCKSGVGPLKSATGDTITDDISKASALNDVFL